MKRMVKNGDLIDVEADGTITVAGKPIGGGGSNDREITLVMPYPRGDTTSNKKLYIDDDTYNKILLCYYETIKLFYNDGNPIGVFHVFNFYDSGKSISDNENYACVSIRNDEYSANLWYGVRNLHYTFVRLNASYDSQGKYVYLIQVRNIQEAILDKSKFDALYKLADKPTQDGTYVLKATVSGGAVTYTWVAQ